jgi:hypothetical protein
MAGGGGSVAHEIRIDRRGAVRFIKRGAGDYRKLESAIAKLIAESSGW